MTEHSSIVIVTEQITPALLAEAASLYATEVFKTRIWSWQFKARFGEIPKAIVARHEGKLIGFNATMPISISLDNNKVIPAIWSCDFIVDKEFRGQGVGSRIKDEMLKHFDCPIMSLGISDSAYPLLLKKGWKSPQQLDILQLLIQPATAKQYLLKVLGLLNSLLYKYKVPAAGENFYCCATEKLPKKEVINSLWSMQSCTDSCATILRDYEYLTWRYQEYPIAAYHFALIYNQHHIASAFLVYRFSSDKHIEICDALGQLEKPEVISALIDYFKRQYTHLSVVTWSASLARFKLNLLANGFVLKRYNTRFVIHDAKGQLEAACWALNAGDSDGDFLRIARDCFIAADNQQRVSPEQGSIHQLVYAKAYGSILYRSQEGYDFSRLEPSDFYHVATEWNELLEKSKANKLFLNWHWVVCWWKQWSNILQFCLSIYFIYYRGQLIGILPLYTYKKGFIRHYQFLGNAWGLAPTVRSEYIGPIFDKTYSSALTTAVSSFFKDFMPNSIIVVPDALSPDIFTLSRLVRRIDSGYYLKTTGSLQEYEATLGKMTRLKAFNRRDYLLENYRSVRLKDVTVNANELADFFSILNGFHLSRWGKPCFNENAVNFHTRFLLEGIGFRPVLSCLEIDGLIVSVSYNLVVGQRFYNIQSGYLEHFDRKISLGTLHMGWMIEQCFNDPTIDEFDFLAGAGKTEDYKSHYKGNLVSYYTVQYFTSKFLCNIFMVAKILKGFSLQRWRQQRKSMHGK